MSDQPKTRKPKAGDLPAGPFYIGSDGKKADAGLYDGMLTSTSGDTFVAQQAIQNARHRGVDTETIALCYGDSAPAPAATPAASTARYKLLDDGFLMRSFGGFVWQILGSDGKWRNGSAIAARYIANGEAGDDDIDAEQAATVAAKFGGDLADMKLAK